MSLNRREFMLGSAALTAATAASNPASAAPAAATGKAQSQAIFSDSVRADFPWASNETYLNSAAVHPLSVHAFRAMQRYLEFRMNGPHAGPPDGREEFSLDRQLELKGLYGELIGAKPSEIAFLQNTSEGENIVASSLDFGKSGNVVIDDLAFATSIYLYKSLERRGVQLRVVPSRDGQVALSEMRQAIDRSTRLVSLPLVSNVNGYLHDIRPIAELAHKQGAYVYADLVQAAGAVPIDMRAMGIDFGTASTFKWLMGERGFSFFFVREEHQESVVPSQRFGHRQLSAGTSRYEPGTIPSSLAVCAFESLRYISKLGLANIRAHARQLTDRLQRELPALGYAPLTPRGNESPIVAFRLKDAQQTAERLKKERIAVTIADKEQRLRIAVSVFNNHADLDQLLGALAAG